MDVERLGEFYERADVRRVLRELAEYDHGNPPKKEKKLAAHKEEGSTEENPETGTEAEERKNRKESKEKKQYEKSGTTKPQRGKKGSRGGGSSRGTSVV